MRDNLANIAGLLVAAVSASVVFCGLAAGVRGLRKLVTGHLDPVSRAPRDRVAFRMGGESASSPVLRETIPDLSRMSVRRRVRRVE